MSNLEEKLISAVYLRSCIYDKSHPHHSKKQIINRAWQDVSEEAGAAGNFPNLKYCIKIT